MWVLYQQTVLPYQGYMYPNGLFLLSSFQLDNPDKEFPPIEGIVQPVKQITVTQMDPWAVWHGVISPKVINCKQNCAIKSNI